MPKLELYKRIIASNITSRRKGIKLIKDGEVKVNGRAQANPNFSVDLDKDEVEVSGRKLDLGGVLDKELKYYILNKPVGVITTVEDTHERETVLDIVAHLNKDERIYPVGRLDKNTRGLLILSNDGELAYRLMHPKFEIDKEYDVTVSPCLKPADTAKITKGVLIADNVKVNADIIKQEHSEDINISKLSLVIHQGIKRQIRRMFDALGYKVVSLKRVRVGPLQLGSLRERECRPLTDVEIKHLKQAVGIK